MIIPLLPLPIGSLFSPVSGEKTTEHISLNSDVGLVSAQDRHSIRLVVKHYFKIYIL